MGMIHLYLQDFTPTKLGCAEILRQGSSVPPSHLLSTYQSRRSGKDMTGMKARMSLPRTSEPSPFD